MLIALTLLPAILGFAGHAGRARQPRARLAAAARGAAGARPDERALGEARHPRPLAVLARRRGAARRVALPAHAHEARPAGRRARRPTTSTERRAYDLLTDGFGPGFNGPLTVVVDAPNLDRPRAEAGRQAASPTASRGSPASPRSRPAAQNEAGDLTIVSVTPDERPGLATRRKDLVDALRDKADEVPAESGIDAYVTGTTALNIDTADRLSAALPKYVRSSSGSRCCC